MRVLGILIAVVMVAAIAFWIAFPSHTYRYRLTISAEVDGGVRSASNVIEVSVRHQPQLLNVPPYAIQARGDAVFLDLGSGRNVVATLRFGPNGRLDRLSSLAQEAFGARDVDEFLATFAYSREVRNLSEEDIPTLVTFSDPADSGSARVVLPREFPLSLWL